MPSQLILTTVMRINLNLKTYNCTTKVFLPISTMWKEIALLLEIDKNSICTIDIDYMIMQQINAFICLKNG